MRKIEFKIKLLIAGLLLLTAFLIAALLFLETGTAQASAQVSALDPGAAPASASEPAGTPSDAGLSAEYQQPDNAVIMKQAEEELALAAVKVSLKAARRSGKSLYFIIDDAGYSIENLLPFLDFPGPLTIAVLPGLEYSAQCAQLALKKGKKVILHQPMEALNGNNTGPFAIKTGMNDKEITDILDKNIRSIPGITGMNNHMGSAVTADLRIMEIILGYLKNKSLIFIDSLTTSDSKCKEAALNLGFSIAQRDIFLDNIDNREAIMESLNTGRSTAENKGYAVMIGHVWSSELADTMMQIYPNLIEDGFTLKDASELLLGDE